MAFNECANLKTITMPNTVTSIGGSVFADCANISSVTLSDKLSSIAESAFANCKSIKSIVIPASVNAIGGAAFGNCELLAHIQCDAVTPPVCESTSFDGVDKATCIVLVPDQSVNTYKNTDVWKEFDSISDVENVQVDDNAVEVARYNLEGVKLSSPQKGLNIVKMSNGKIYKRMVTE